MAEAINADVASDTITTLQAEWGSAPVTERRVTVPAAEFPDLVANARDGYRGGGYAFVTRTPDQVGPATDSYAGAPADEERALLILPRGDAAWGVPGGGLEGGESFPAAARREVREETGIGCEPTGLWLLQRLVWASEDPAEDRTTHSVHAFFDADYVEGSITVQPGEIAGAAWFADAPADLLAPTDRRADRFFGD